MPKVFSIWRSPALGGNFSISDNHKAVKFHAGLLFFLKEGFNRGRVDPGFLRRNMFKF